SASSAAGSTILPVRPGAGNEERMDREHLAELLRALERGETTVDDVVERLRTLPFEDLGFARLDHHRELRTGFGAGGFGAGEVAAIARRMVEVSGRVLVTRVDAEAAAALVRTVPGATHHPRAGLVMCTARPVRPLARGPLLVLSAGTADLPVAEEAALAAEFL